MSRKSYVRDSVVQLLDKWLDSELGTVSEDRGNVLNARGKICSNFRTLSSEEAEAVIACVMEEIDVESEKADEFIDMLQTMKLQDEGIPLKHGLIFA
jgi:hypothetical protein